MANYTVSITDGSGSALLPAGTYAVTATVTGYDGPLDPTAFTATTSAGSEDFTLEATGTLTLIVNETGASGGAPVTDGSFIRCSSDGLTQYGSAKAVDNTGTCVFDHVPFGDSTTPFTFYVMQLTSDETHNIYAGVITIDMAGSTQTEYVQNTLAGLQTFSLTDDNYSGLGLNGTLNFTGP